VRTASSSMSSTLGGADGQHSSGSIEDELLDKLVGQLHSYNVPLAPIRLPDGPDGVKEDDGGVDDT
jgi:hypothetical protein